MTASLRPQWTGNTPQTRREFQTPPQPPGITPTAPSSIFPNGLDTLETPDRDDNPMNQSIFSTGLGGLASLSDVTTERPAPSPPPEPSCFDRYCSSFHRAYLWIVRLIRKVCCCSGQEIDYEARAVVLKHKFDQTTDPEERMKTMRSLTELRIDCDTIDSEYKACLNLLTEDDFWNWLDLYSEGSEASFDDVKKERALVFRALDYECAHFAFLKIESESNEDIMKEVLKLNIAHSGDKKAFQNRCLDRLSSGIDDETAEKFRVEINS